MTGNRTEIDEYMSDDEEISYTLSHRPTGIVNWIRSLFGYGVTHWYVTNQRIVEHERVTGGFNFRDVQMGKVSSIEYGRKLNVVLVALGVLFSLGGLGSFAQQEPIGIVLLLAGVAMVGWALYRRSQALIVHASGGVTLSLAISQGEQIDDFLWYAHAERQKHASTTSTAASNAKARSATPDGGTR